MPYFSYHKTAKKLINEGKLLDYYIVQEYHGIKPALILIFNDERHPVMPIRQHKFKEYFDIISNITID